MYLPVHNESDNLDLPACQLDKFLPFAILCFHYMRCLDIPFPRYVYFVIYMALTGTRNWTTKLCTYACTRAALAIRLSVALGNDEIIDFKLIVHNILLFFNLSRVCD
jgi:hypothetical protein